MATYRTTVTFEDGYVSVREWDEYPTEYIQKHEFLNNNYKMKNVQKRTVVVEEVK